jgi:hypothetical protein
MSYASRQTLEDFPRSHSLDDEVCQLADAGNLEQLGVLIATRSQLERARVVRLLGGNEEGPVALVARAAGLSSNAYSAVLRFRRRLLKQPVGSPALLLTSYGQLPRSTPRELRAVLVVAFGEAADSP